MADYITKIRTDQGDLPYDYNSLANKPSIGSTYTSLATLEEGTVPTGTAQWKTNSLALTVGDLREWEWFWFNFSTTVSNGVKFIVGSSVFYEQSTDGGVLCHWLDKDKTILQCSSIVTKGYPPSKYGVVGGYDFSNGTYGATTFFRLIPASVSDTEPVKIYTHNELTADVIYKVEGILKF